MMLQHVMHPDNLVDGHTYRIEWLQPINQYEAKRRFDDVVFFRLKTNRKRLLLVGCVDYRQNWKAPRIAIPWKSIRSIESLEE